MQGDTEAVVFSLVKTLKGRGMMTLFTERYGKLSAGAFLREKAGAAALRPFAYGSYQLRGGGGVFHVSRAEALHGFYAIGENLERYVNAAFALELTGKLLPEEEPSQEQFSMLLAFLRLMEGRSRDFDTPTLAYMAKSLKLWGAALALDSCAACGRPTPQPSWVSVKEGGAICGACAGRRAEASGPEGQKLLYKANFDIVNVMRYLLDTPMEAFAGLSLDGDMAKSLRGLLREHVAYHLDIAKLKSERLMEGAGMEGWLERQDNSMERRCRHGNHSGED